MPSAAFFAQETSPLVPEIREDDPFESFVTRYDGEILAADELRVDHLTALDLYTTVVWILRGHPDFHVSWLLGVFEDIDVSVRSAHLFPLVQRGGEDGMEDFHVDQHPWKWYAVERLEIDRDNRGFCRASQAES